MLFTLAWSPYREYLNFLTKELSFNNKHVEEAENFDFFWIYKSGMSIHLYTSGRSFWLYIMLNQTITLMLTLLNVHIISF